MRKIRFAPLSLTLVTVVIFLALFFDWHGTVFLSRSTIIGDQEYFYKVYRPADWTPQKKWRVVLFLHGAGERGDDNVAQTTVGLGPYLRKNGLNALVVMLQCPEGHWWTEPEMEEAALKALDETIKEFNGDEKQIYLTGISMGGYGTWSIAAHHPQKFAAIVPICGGIRSLKIKWRDLTIPAVSVAKDPYADIAGRITCPVRTFHGKDDDVIPVSEQRLVVQALRAVGRTVVEKEYDGLGHHIWDEAYGNHELWDWIFAQHLKQSN